MKTKIPFTSDKDIKKEMKEELRDMKKLKEWYKDDKEILKTLDKREKLFKKKLKK